MGQLRDVQTFVQKASTLESLPELRDVLGDVSERLGFRYFALGHHTNVLSGNLLQIGNYPESWMEAVFARGYIAIDPALTACQRAVVGFRWREIPRLITLSREQKQILEDSRRAGFGEGFTVPIHIPGECAASCNFVTANGKEVPAYSVAPAQYIGCFAFEAARRIIERETAPGPVREHVTLPSLSPRQHDCVVLAARGKSDWDAGQLLGISNETVHKHLEEAKRRYGVATRAQLIVRALFDGQLSFRDVLNLPN